MAMSIIFTCDQCGYSLEGWDDGNPYIEHPAGKRHYFYHPDGERTLEEIASKILGHLPSPDELEKIEATCTGNAPDHICRACGKTSKVDPDKDKKLCPSCGSEEIEDLYNLGGTQCIKCPGIFSEGSMGAIS